MECTCMTHEEQIALVLFEIEKLKRSAEALYSAAVKQHDELSIVLAILERKGLVSSKDLDEARSEALAQLCAFPRKPRRTCHARSL